jgi:N-acetyl-alpha-D-muramate 1-phosphate uridylyltransferase
MSTSERRSGLAAGAMPPVCILAGGLGTRLGEHVRNTPKPLLNVAGEPFLVHQLRLLARHGVERVVLCVGYLGELIVERLGSSQSGIEISYSFDGPTPIGTLGAIRKAAPLLAESFLVIYGDTYLRLDYRDVVNRWQHSGLPAVMTVLRNEGRWDTSNAEFDGERVLVYDKRASARAMRWIDYGLGGLQRSLLTLASPNTTDLADLYHDLARCGKLLGYAASERFYEIGTPDALVETDIFLSRLHASAS